MAIAPITFSPDPGKILDFSGHRPADIFNQAILPRVNSFLDLMPEDPGGLEEARRTREAQLGQDLQLEQALRQEDEDFFQQLKRRRSELGDVDESQASTDSGMDYDSPVSKDRFRSASESEMKDPQASGFFPVKLKLANYGYQSDTSGDYNSLVKKIGHANNRLVDGYSAALTKSLAKRYGLNTGDEFEIVTADGKVMRRRYDDTVPPMYKGKALPETVDLYETGGSNNFGGRVIGIRPLKKKKTKGSAAPSNAPEPELPPAVFTDTAEYDNPLLPPRS